MDLDEAQLIADDAMEKAVEYLKNELRGVRTGRASTALVEYIKIDYFDSPTDLRQLALISVPEPMQLVVKPFDASSMQTIVKGIQSAGLGLNPIAEGKQIRVTLPALTTERRHELQGAVKHMGEQAKVAIRNSRRDGNKHVDQAEKDKSLHLSEDVVKDAKEEIQDLVKKYEGMVETCVEAKLKEVMQI